MFIPWADNNGGLDLVPEANDTLGTSLGFAPLAGIRIKSKYDEWRGFAPEPIEKGEGEEVELGGGNMGIEES